MSSAGNSATQRRIPELDGLRGTAILLVLVFHYITQDYDAKAGGLVAHLQRIVALGGGAGVDLFFVLSGFLIGGILLDARKAPSFFKVFYARRFFRIIPLYYAWIALYIVMVALAGPIVQAHTHFDANLTLDSGIYRYFVFIQNLTVPHLTGLGIAWFASTWSLAVEEQFYLVSPLVVRLFSKRRLYQFLTAVIVAVPLLRIYLLTETHLVHGLVYFLTPCRADTLAVGMLTAALWREPKFRQWLSDHGTVLYGLFAVLLAGFVELWRLSPNYLSFPMETVGYTWVALFFALLLLLVLRDTASPFASLMRTGWLRELGSVSYCVYIIHLVVNIVCHTVLLHANPQISTRRGIAVTIFAAGLTFALAKLSWFCLERPLLRKGQAFKYDDEAVAVRSKPQMVPLPS